jgi:hypothetical protein
VIKFQALSASTPRAFSSISSPDLNPHFARDEIAFQARFAISGLEIRDFKRIANYVYRDPLRWLLHKCEVANVSQKVACRANRPASMVRDCLGRSHIDINASKISGASQNCHKILYLVILKALNYWESWQH